MKFEGLYYILDVYYLKFYDKDNEIFPDKKLTFWFPLCKSEPKRFFSGDGLIWNRNPYTNKQYLTKHNIAITAILANPNSTEKELKYAKLALVPEDIINATFHYQISKNFYNDYYEKGIINDDKYREKNKKNENKRYRKRDI